MWVFKTSLTVCSVVSVSNMNADNRRLERRRRRVRSRTLNFQIKIGLFASMKALKR